MTLAVRADVELFRYVGHEKELHQETIAFSISHDHSKLWTYSHYAVINGPEQKDYRHTIPKFDAKFDVTALDAKNSGQHTNSLAMFMRSGCPNPSRRSSLLLIASH